MPNQSVLFFKFLLAGVHDLILKIFLFQAIQFSQKVLIKKIQFSIFFVHIQVSVKTGFFFQKIQFSLSRVSMSKTVLFQTIKISISMQFHVKAVLFL